MPSVSRCIFATEPRILMDCTFQTNSGGRFTAPTSDRNVRFGSTAEITDIRRDLFSVRQHHALARVRVYLYAFDFGLRPDLAARSALTAFARACVISPALPTLTCDSPPRFSQLCIKV